MWMLAPNMPILLETLDRTGQPLAGVAACLYQMDDEQAHIALEDACSSPSFHWGTPVRFNLQDGTNRYEVTGVIVGRGAAPDLEPSELANATRAQDLRVRLWDCQLSVQRRSMPRRKSRFPLQYRSLDELDGTAALHPGWCVDIGGGGIRLRVSNCEALPKRMELEFQLPVYCDAEGGSRVHHFVLTARVIRTERSGRHSDSTDVTLCFESLSIADGLALTNLLDG